jgi:hypothetical protein
MRHPHRSTRGFVKDNRFTAEISPRRDRITGSASTKRLGKPEQIRSTRSTSKDRAATDSRPNPQQQQPQRDEIRIS